MRIAKCPICEGEKFYFARNVIPGVRIVLGFFSLWGPIPVRSRVCLSCGFVAPSVDQKGLVAIRKKAKINKVVIDRVPETKQLPEL
jgi:hypothetical protein